MKQKIWQVKPFDEAIVKKIAQENELPQVIATLLFNRGLIDKQQIDYFLNPGIDKFHDPFLMKDMDEAVARIMLARENHEPITIYGDYDVDGITSTSVLYLFLKEMGLEVDYYIPDRIQEGYGLNIDAIKKIKDNGTKLMITVDTGIAAIKEARYAHEVGLDLIITDHHECQEILPEGIAVLDPKREDCKYPFKLLAGVGVTFKLIHGLSIKWQTENVIWKYLELVAVGTVADIVKLQDENRVIVQLAFRTMCNSWNIGLKALLNISGFQKSKITTGIIGFQIGPRLNASGRLGDAKRGVELFTTKDEIIAQEIAKNLNEENLRRQSIESDILEQALERIAMMDLEHKKVLVISGQNWNHGVIGIVASRIVEKFYLPTILLTIEEGIASGSARSVEGFSIFEALNQCKDLFEKFGGHDMAAGMSLKAENILELDRRLNAYADLVMEETTLIPKITADFALDLKMVTNEFIEKISTFEPYGIGNEEPQFILSGTMKSIKRMGQNNNHIRMELSHEALTLPVVGFNCGEYDNTYSVNNPVEIMGTLNINEWLNKRSPQIMAKDVRFQPNYEATIEKCIQFVPELMTCDRVQFQDMIPNRKDYESVYRYLYKLQAQHMNEVTITKLLPVIEQDMPEQLIKVMICLEVFKELGLLAYDIRQLMLVFKIIEGKKVELKASKLYNKWTG